jgi:hypothetical protein
MFMRCRLLAIQSRTPDPRYNLDVMLSILIHVYESEKLNKFSLAPDCSVIPMPYALDRTEKF